MYLDEETDRIRARAQAEFDSMVEGVRAGTIFAHDGKQHARWRAESDRRAHRKPTGRNLAQLAHDFGGNIVVGEFEFRES
jgi:hypothetical protein